MMNFIIWNLLFQIFENIFWKWKETRSYVKVYTGSNGSRLENRQEHILRTVLLAICIY